MNHLIGGTAIFINERVSGYSMITEGEKEYYLAAAEAGLSEEDAGSLLKKFGNYTFIEKIVFEKPENLIISIREAKKNLGTITKEDVQNELFHQKAKYYQIAPLETGLFGF